jgi:hypothetical protein
VVRVLLLLGPPRAAIAALRQGKRPEDVLELGHGFSRETLVKLVLAGLAELVTETLRVKGGTFTIERLHVTDRWAGDARLMSA